MKPEGWPRYLREKRLKNGSIAYFWEPPSIYVRQGFKGQAEALGTSYAAACERAQLLTTYLDDWRTGGSGENQSKKDLRTVGTIAWMFDRYLKSPAFEQRVSERSCYEYRRALSRIEDISTTMGGTVAELRVASITPAAVDKIYAKLQTGPRGKRVRQANLSIDVASRAWDVVRRLAPSVVPAENPWRGVLRVTVKETKPAASRQEAYALAQALKEIGEPHLGAAALICFELHQRPEYVRNGDITWADYRPPHRPDAVQIRHPKTGAKGWVPLEDDRRATLPRA